MNPQEIRNAADVMREGWRIAQGRAPNDGELLYSLLVARHESSFGRGWKGEMRGSNNWGAIQCGAAAKGATCIEHEDTHPNGTKYKTNFRAYPSAAEGAADVVRHLTVYRKGVGETMKRKPSLSEFARAMREEKYYGGFCPQATKAGGKFSYGAPKSEREVACHEEAIAGYVKANEKHLRQIAEALSMEPPPVEAPASSASVLSAGKSFWPWALGAAVVGVGAAYYWRRS